MGCWLRTESQQNGLPCCLSRENAGYGQRRQDGGHNSAIKALPLPKIPSYCQCLGDIITYSSCKPSSLKILLKWSSHLQKGHCHTDLKYLIFFGCTYELNRIISIPSLYHSQSPWSLSKMAENGTVPLHTRRIPNKKVVYNLIWLGLERPTMLFIVCCTGTQKGCSEI